jgi:hypothetical protein
MSGISTQQNKDPQKGERERKKKKKERKRKEQGLKSKRGKPHMKKLHVSKGEKKKKEDEIYKLLGEILSKERKKERISHFPIVQNPMCDLIHTDTSFAFALPSIP